MPRKIRKLKRKIKDTREKMKSIKKPEIKINPEGPLGAVRERRKNYDRIMEELERNYNKKKKKK